MKSLLAIFVLIAFFIPGRMFAQNGAGLNETATTKVLAIGSIITPLTLEERSAILPKEVRETVKLYLQGRIDQWWFRQDDKGVVFLLNVSSINAASAMLEKLPLGLAKRMKFEFIQVGPLKPLQYLLNDE